MQRHSFIKTVFFAVLLLSPLLINPVLAQTNQASAKEIEKLKRFVRTYKKQSADLRLRNAKNQLGNASNQLNERILNKSLYRSLGYQTRDPFVAMPPELTSRLYKSDQSLLQAKLIENMEYSWALLDSTRARVTKGSSWLRSVIDRNIIFDGIYLWFKSANNENFSRYLSELNNKIKARQTTLAEEPDQTDENTVNADIVLLGLNSDSIALGQYYSYEGANLFSRTNSRNLPNSDVNTRYGYKTRFRCFADENRTNKGRQYLKTLYPDKAKLLNSRTNLTSSELWELKTIITEVSRSLLKKPKDKNLLAANYFLSDKILINLFLIQQQRLNAFIKNPERFFQERSIQTKNIEIQLLQTALHDVFDFTLTDFMFAGERLAFINLALFRSCDLLQSPKNLLAQSAEVALTKYAAKLQTRALYDVNVKRNLLIGNSIQTEIAKDGVAEKDVFDEKEQSNQTVTVSGQQTVEATQSALIEEVNQQKLPLEEEIDFATASKRLEAFRFELTPPEKVLQKVQGNGYSIQVVATSSAKAAADYARNYQIENDVIVYWATAKVQGQLLKRYKVLVGFYDADELNAQQFRTLYSRAKKMQGYFKKFSAIREDVIP